MIAIEKQDHYIDQVVLVPGKVLIVVGRRDWLLFSSSGLFLLLGLLDNLLTVIIDEHEVRGGRRISSS